MVMTLKKLECLHAKLRAELQPPGRRLGHQPLRGQLRQSAGVDAEAQAREHVGDPAFYSSDDGQQEGQRVITALAVHGVELPGESKPPGSGSHGATRRAPPKVERKPSRGLQLHCRG